MVDQQTLPTNAIERLIGRLATKAHLTNGPVFSFEHDNFQVDMICDGEPEYSFVPRYFAYNDLGDFLGRVARRMGFIYGHGGLLYPIYAPASPTQLLAKVPVTVEFEAAVPSYLLKPA